MKFAARIALMALVLSATAFAEDEKAPAPGEGMTAIVGGDVYTMSRGTIRGATLLIDRDGKVAEVGVRVTVPDGARIVDAKGKKVTPGFVAVLAQGVGVSGPYGGRNRIADALDPYDLNAELALSTGITTVFTRGRSGSMSAVYKLGGDDLEKRVLREPAAVTLSYSGPAERFGLRENLAKARAYLAAKREHEAAVARGEKPPEPKKTAGDDYLALVSREMPLRLGVNSADEIRAALALTDEFGVRLILEGAHESWIVADELARRGAAVILSPRRIPERDRMREGPSGGTIECARILEEKGVRYAVLPVGGFGASGSGVSLMGIGGRDLLFLAMEAAFAVRGGASEESALAGITAAAAELLGVADRIGSLAPGKDADFVIWSGDPLAVTSQAEQVYVDGRLVHDRADAKLWK